MEIENKTQTNLPAKKSNGKKYIAIILALLVLGGAGSYFFLPKNLNLWSKLDISSLSSGNAAAVINGEKITKTDLDLRIEQARESIQSQGIDLSDEKIFAEIKKQVLDDMINEKILLQNAKKGGFVATDAEVQTAYSQLISRYETQEDFKKELIAKKITEEEVKENLTREITLNKYIEQSVDLKSVDSTDAEIKELYKNYSAQQENMPKLEEIKDQLANQVKQQKTRTIIFNFIEKLKSNADIKILL